MFDGQVVRPPQKFWEAAKDYVCVRITNINEIDLNLFPFDFDLTMAILLASPDGTTYHRYGGRSNLSPMSMVGLVDLMQKGLQTHREHLGTGKMPEEDDPFILPQVVNGPLSGVMQPVTGCFHCHYAREAKQLLALNEGDWTPDKFWIYPQAEQLGLVMDQEIQYRVGKVIPKSAAESAGIKSGDLLESISGNRVLTKNDIQWQLDQQKGSAIKLPFTLRRGDKRLKGKLALGEGWKIGDPQDYSWRVANPFTAHMIKFLPTPGLVGDRLTPSEMREASLPESGFGLRVTKLNHGPHQAGVRLGDIILGAAGRTEFATTRDFYAWCEELRRAGRDIKIQLRREGNELAMMVSLSYLNYSRMERAPRVEIGFTPQQLPGDGGIRVGMISEDSSAEHAGLVTGDLIVRIDGETAPTGEKFESLVNKKTPGDLLMLDLNRKGRPIMISYILPGEGQVRSDLARLGEPLANRGKQTDCIVTINLPPGRHVYSAHKKGLGIPTGIEFRGTGFRLVGELVEPEPKSSEGDWILEGEVEFRQRIEVTDPDRLRIRLRVYAQVCDASSCHEFQAILQSDGTAKFFEFNANFDQVSKLAQ